MPTNQMLTVRMPKEAPDKLDQMSAVQGRPGSQLVQEALNDLICKNKKLRNLECARLKKVSVQQSRNSASFSAITHPSRTNTDHFEHKIRE